MKVCFISTFPPEKDGVGEYLNFLLSAFRKDGFFTFYVLARQIAGATTTSPNSQTIVLRLWNMSGPLLTLNSWAKIITFVRKIKPDLIHIQYGPTRLYGGTIGEPFLVLIFLLRLISKSKVILSLHSFWLPSEAEQRAFELVGSRLLSRLYKYYYCLYFWILLRSVHVVLGIVVESNSDAYRKLILLARSKKVREMPHGIPGNLNIVKKSRDDIRQQLGLENRFVILLFGDMRRDKGYEKVITAFFKSIQKRKELMRRGIVILAGTPHSIEDQDYPKYLAKQASDLGISQNIRLVNKYLDEKEVEKYFRACDIVMLPYTRRVGPSGVLLLALSYNSPVVINIDGRFVRRKSRLPVILIDDTNPLSLSNVMINLVSRPGILNDLRKKIVNWKDMYSFSEIAKLHEDLYKHVIAGAL